MRFWWRGERKLCWICFQWPDVLLPMTLNEKYLVDKLQESHSPHREMASRQVPAEMRIREFGGDEFNHAFIHLSICSTTTKGGPPMCKTQYQLQNVASDNERALGAWVKIRRGFISAGWVEMDPKAQRKFTLLSCVKLSCTKYYMNTLQKGTARIQLWPRCVRVRVWTSDVY